MVERRLHRSALHSAAVGRETFAQHLAPRVVSKKPEVRRTIYVCQPLAEGD
jgi:hypothetical protein